VITIIKLMEMVKEKQPKLKDEDPKIRKCKDKCLVEILKHINNTKLKS